VIEEWVEQCSRGQVRAYAWVVQALQPKVLNYLFRMTQSRELAEDLGQEIFLRAFQMLDKYDRSKSTFTTWLFTIARNRCLDDLRRNKPPLLGAELIDLQCSPFPDPMVSAQELELGQLIAGAVARLEPEFREVFILKEYENLPLDDIALIVRCPVGTVKSRLHRARIQLQEQLAPVINIP
jgi:RNA polymerase sigma-70 factor (ECF subfamily)